MAKCRPNRSMCGMKDGLFNPFFTGNYANPYSYSGGDTPLPPDYDSLSNLELRVKYSGLEIGTNNDYGIVDGSGNITTLKSLSPAPLTRDFTSNGTAPTLSADGIVFGGAGRLRAGVDSKTWANFLHYNATRTNLKHTIHVVLKIASSVNPGVAQGIFGNNATTGAAKGFHLFYADANTSNNNAIVSAITSGVATLLSNLQSDALIANRFFVLSVETDLSQTGSLKQKVYINGELLLNINVADTGGALVTTPTHDLEIGGCGNATLPFNGVIKEITVQSTVDTSEVRSAFITALINEHNIETTMDSIPIEVYNPFNVYSDGRYPITNTLLRSISNPDVLVMVYSDWELGHTWRATNVISTRKSTDNGRTWGARTVIYSDALFGVIESGGGVDPDTGEFHMFFNVHSGSGTTIDTGFKLLHIVSSDDGETWSAPEDLASLIPATDLAWVYGGMIKNNGVLMKPYYTIDAPGDTNPNSVRILRKDGSGDWTSVLVEANTTEYRNEGEIIGLSSTHTLMIVRDDILFEWRQYMSTDNGLNWTNQGAITFGYSNTFGSPVRLKKIQISGVDVIIVFIADRANRRIQAIAGLASELIANGLTGWDLDTKITIRQYLTSPVNQPEYGDFSFVGNTMQGIMSFALDDGTGGASITSVIHTASIPTWHYEFWKSTLGI